MATKPIKPKKQIRTKPTPQQELSAYKREFRTLLDAQKMVFAKTDTTLVRLESWARKVGLPEPLVVETSNVLVYRFCESPVDGGAGQIRIASDLQDALRARGIDVLVLPVSGDLPIESFPEEGMARHGWVRAPQETVLAQESTPPDFAPQLPDDDSP